jgi:alanine racemase
VRANRAGTGLRLAQISIDTAALQHNLQCVKQFAPRSKILAVIKANAYGHGVITAARALAAADGFALAMTGEALQLRAAGFEQALLVLQGFQTLDELAQLAEQNIATVVHHETQLELLEKYPGPELDVWLKLDTGMHRLGFACDQVAALVARLQVCSGVGRIRLLSHFANADVIDNQLNIRQLESFIKANAGSGFESSLANSAAIVSLPQSHFDWVRPGIMLYGSSPLSSHSAAELGLKAVMRFSAPVIAVKQLSAGDTVGYGSTWICERDTRVAYIAAGYADGYPRHACAGTPVQLNGQRCQLIGRVSMDSICIELGDLEVAVGDLAELWGEHISVDEVASGAGTISYELLCQAGNALDLL